MSDDVAEMLAWLKGYAECVRACDRYGQDGDVIARLNRVADMLANRQTQQPAPTPDDIANMRKRLQDAACDLMIAPERCLNPHSLCEEAAEMLERLEAFRTAYLLWQEKTEWIQEACNAGKINIPGGTLGLHRADVMRKIIECLESQVAALDSRMADESTWGTGLLRISRDNARQDLAEAVALLREWCQHHGDDIPADGSLTDRSRKFWNALAGIDGGQQNGKGR